jgi:hypothetical protein
MDGRKLLSIALVAGLLAAVLPVSEAIASPCAGDQIRGGSCGTTGTSNGSDVDLVTHVRQPGSAVRRHGSSGSSDSAQSLGPRAVCNEQKFRLPCNPRSSGAGAVTISDIAHFKPRPGTDHMQPNGWMVVGLDTNFYATVPSELEHGDLLGQPAQVRFFPVAWHWTYGDGAQATVGSPGGTWAAQGLRDFDATPTSHLYRAKGLYVIDLDIQFGAEYQYAGDGWTPIAGTIDVPANRLKAVAGDAKTVLVNHDCLVNPNGPGC